MPQSHLRRLCLQCPGDGNWGIWRGAQLIFARRELVGNFKLGVRIFRASADEFLKFPKYFPMPGAARHLQVIAWCPVDAQPIFTRKAPGEASAGHPQMPCRWSPGALPWKNIHGASTGYLKGIYSASGDGLQMPFSYPSDTCLIELGNHQPASLHFYLLSWPQRRCWGDFSQMPPIARNPQNPPILVHRLGTVGNVTGA